MEEAKKIPPKGSQTKAKEKEKPIPKQKVISGLATVKKKSLGEKILETFLPGDIQDIKKYAWNEIILPAFKRTLDDFISQGAHMLIYPGDTTYQRDRRRSDGVRASFDYGRQYRSRDRDRDRDYDFSSRSRFDDSFELDRVTFSNRVDAEMVLDSMENVLADYPFVRVSDFFEFAGISTENYQAANYGWTSLRDADIRRDFNGDYYIKFPRIMPID